MNQDFVDRLRRTFGNGSMAVVARRLGVPHATVRNYYQGRLPAPEVLMKIASETGISLNWLLLGTGEMYAGDIRPMDLNSVLEAKIAEMIDRRITPPVKDLGLVDGSFDVRSAVEEYDEPGRVMDGWFRYEGREYPADFGVAFFRGWNAFTFDEKVAAVRDAKRVLDRALATEK